MRVGLLLKRDTPEATRLGGELRSHLAARGVATVVVGDPVDPYSGARTVADEQLEDTLDLLVVLGGDGTLLHAAELISDQAIPMLGINLGHLGFLTSSSPEQGLAVVDLALDGKLEIERRMRLRVTLAGERGSVTRHACNDAVISQGSLARLLEFEAFLDGARITTYRADGLIIATPTGSTAYTLAAGGPILSPDVQAMVITPICPHALTNRPLVVPAQSRFEVRLGSEAHNLVLTVDGQWGAAFSPGDRVEIAAASQPMLLCRPPDLNYFDILRTKLHWGEGARRP